MIFKGKHIYLLWLFLGVFSFQYVVADSFSGTNICIEKELEESLEEVIESVFDGEYWDSGPDGGGNPIIPIQEIRTPIFPVVPLKRWALALENSSPRPHLFILYCCLKIDC